jgi:hypothetical protein
MPDDIPQGSIPLERGYDNRFLKWGQDRLLRWVRPTIVMQAREEGR